MDFNEYLKKTLEEDSSLCKEFNALQPEYEIIEKLIKVRAEYNLTQKELAKKCGIKQSNISRLESGKGNPTIKFLQKLADGMDCDLYIEFRKREPATETIFETVESSNIIRVNYAFSMYNNEHSKSKEYVAIGSQALSVATI